jgi:hypothetical protein
VAPVRPDDVPLSDSAGTPTTNLTTQLRNLARRHPASRSSRRSVTASRSCRSTRSRTRRTPGACTTAGVRRSSTRRPSTPASGSPTEVERRTLRLFLDNYRRKGAAIGTDGQPIEGVDAKEITKLVNHRELWFILVANPDGYDFTFTPENRLWRKNLHDNDGDGQITAVDGVDPNRNFPNHWKWDDEGSNTDTSSETYRGTAPASEPETRAFLSLTDRVHFAWNKTTTPSARSSSGPSAGRSTPTPRTSRS